MSISLRNSKVWSRGRNAPFDTAVAVSQFSCCCSIKWSLSGNCLLLIQMHFFYELSFCCFSWSMLPVLLLWPPTSGIGASRYCAQMETCRENRYFDYTENTALWIVLEQGNCQIDIHLVSCFSASLRDLPWYMCTEAFVSHCSHSGSHPDIPGFSSHSPWRSSVSIHPYMLPWTILLSQIFQELFFVPGPALTFFQYQD